MDLLNENRFERGSEAWAQFLPTLRKHKLIIFLVFVFTVLSAYGTLESIAVRHPIGEHQRIDRHQGGIARLERVGIGEQVDPLDSS